MIVDDPQTPSGEGVAVATQACSHALHADEQFVVEPHLWGQVKWKGAPRKGHPR